IISLISVAILPIAFIFPCIFLSVKYVGAGMVMTILLQWIPGVNPITTIFLVGPYRREVFGKFCNFRFRIHQSSQLSSTVHNSIATPQAPTDSRLDRSPQRSSIGGP
ncbi:hypothetical protein AAVH_30227, partial [Aphelenchoides avenae]